MNARGWIAYWKLPVNESQLRACEYLEMYGFRFLVHFGYANAEDKAREHWRQRYRRLRRWR